jgi:hypothetical protein
MASPHFVGVPMYWSEFSRLIRRHAPHPASILFLKHDGTPQDIQTICDLNRPRRHGQLFTGHTYEDLMRDAFVCNAAWLNGEIPLVGWKGTDINTDRPARGAITTIKILLTEGAIRPSRELDALLGESSWKHSPREIALHYDEVNDD